MKFANLLTGNPAGAAVGTGKRSGNEVAGRQQEQQVQPGEKMASAISDLNLLWLLSEVSDTTLIFVH